MLKKLCCCPRAARFVLMLMLLAAMSALVACGGGNDGLGDNDNCDYIMAVTTNGSLQDKTDRLCPKPLILDMDCLVDFRDGGGPGSTPAAQFYVAYYDVTYRNDRTGGSTAGVDVPAPIRKGVATVVDDGGVANMTGARILEEGQKLSAPLNDDSYYGVGGTPLTATITWWGWPLGNPDAVCYGVLYWPFTVESQGPVPPETEAEFLASCE